MPDLSVIIVSYNTRELLRACLLSLRESQGVALEIIVVDNASSDGSADMVQRDFPEVILLPQTLNTWYCGGNNIGIDRASADYAMLLNPDTEVAPDALVKLLDYLRANPEYIGVTGQLRIRTARSSAPAPKFRRTRACCWITVCSGICCPGKGGACMTNFITPSGTGGETAKSKSCLVPAP